MSDSGTNHIFPYGHVVPPTTRDRSYNRRTGKRVRFLSASRTIFPTTIISIRLLISTSELECRFARGDRGLTFCVCQAVGESRSKERSLVGGGRLGCRVVERYGRLMGLKKAIMSPDMTVSGTTCSTYHRLTAVSFPPRKTAAQEIIPFLSILSLRYPSTCSDMV
jgi:hypothetical protein